MDKKSITAKVRKILKIYKVKKAFFFGSFARAGKFSDIDILFDPPARFTFLDLASMGVEIEEATAYPVDLVTRRSVDPKLRKHISPKEIVL